MPKPAAPDHNHFHYRLRLGRAEPGTMPESTYRGRLRISQPMRSTPPANTWMRKRTRGLIVFYFSHLAASEEHRQRRKQRRKLEHCGEKPELPPPSFVWIPLEPSRHLWVTLPVPDGMTHQEAVKEALWSPITEDVRTALEWWVNFIDDKELPLNYSTAMQTQRFARDLLSGAPPSGLLIEYIGDLVNDGSVDHCRQPELSEFPCLI